MVYAFLNQKGGVGKTTLSLHLADALARRGSRVLVIDADPQQSAMKWAGIRAGENRFSVIGMAKPTLHKEMSPIAADYSDVVIDGPPRVTDLARSIILAADVMLVPVQPSTPDIWATAETVDLIGEASAFKETQKSAILLNRKGVGTVIGREARAALEELQTTVLQADIASRTIFAEAFTQGLVVSDLDPRSKAAQEVEAVVSEITKLYEKTQHEGPSRRRSRRR